MRVKDIMATAVVSVGPDDSVADIARLLLEHRIGAVPVLADSSRLVGMVSKSDLLRRRELGTDKRRPAWRAALVSSNVLAREYARSRGLKARDVMTAPVFTIGREAPLAEVADIMDAHGVHRLPVLVDRQLAGMVTRTDVARALLRELADAATPAAGDDAAIRRNLEQRIRDRAWTGSAELKITVERGEVTLAGSVYSAEHAVALRVMAETIPGVTAVHRKLQVRTAE